MTKMKSVILTAALGLASLAFGNTKTYNVVLSQSAQAGNTQLAAGSYKMNLNGHVATFTNVDTNKSVMVMFRLDNGVRNYEHTAVDVKAENGGQRIESIELEDSNSKLEF